MSVMRMLGTIKTALRSGRESVRRYASAQQRKKSHIRYTSEDLLKDMRKLGIEQGDALFVHSSLRSIGFVEGGAEAVIQTLQEAVGEDGTFLIPTYYMPGGTIHGTCALSDYVFDFRKHGTHMGRIPEVFLKTPGIHRSIHPTHSVSAWGRYARQFTEAHHRAPSIFGQGSPWQRFLDTPKAKVFGLGVSMGPVTFYHLIEDSLGTEFPLPVWQDKVYELPCVDESGALCHVPVRPFNPAVVTRRIDYPACEDLRAYFWRDFALAGLLGEERVGGADAWIVDAGQFYERLILLAKHGITIYSTPEDLAATPAGTVKISTAADPTCAA